MRSYGLNGLKEYVRKGITLGNVFSDLLRSRSDLFEIITKPVFGLTVFRVKAPKLANANGAVVNGSTVAKPDEHSDAVTKEVYELVNARGEIFITSTVMAGIYAIRVVSANERADEKYIRRAFDILVNTAEEALQKAQ